MKILTIIPARGNSKGIPQKNIRLLNGKPLLSYVIKTALNSKFNLDIYVSSENDGILKLARELGAKSIKRNSVLSNDEVTLDPVVYESFNIINKNNNINYDAIMTMQPTSPLLSSDSLNKAIDYFFDKKIDTLISAKENIHLEYKKEKNQFIPLYEKRLNRQFAKSKYVETGSFLITKPEFVCKNSRIGKTLDLFILNNKEGIDIDTPEDWAVCEYFINKKNIGLVLTSNDPDKNNIFKKFLSVVNRNMSHNFFFIFTQGLSNYNKIILSLNHELIVSNKLIDVISKKKIEYLIINKNNVSKKIKNNIDFLNIKIIDANKISRFNHKQKINDIFI